MIRPSRFFACRALALLAFFLALPAQAAFTDNGDGTVTDTVTGLMWDKCSWGQSNDTDCGGGAATIHTWVQALGVAVSANGTNYKSHNDWRLPNKNELESLVKIDASIPAIDTAVFPNTVSSWYWTSTSYAPVPVSAWGVDFISGSTYADGRTNDGYVRLVRGGQFFDPFDAQGDFTPDAFSFTAQTDAALSSVSTSNTITVAGISTVLSISIVGGTYSINGGAYTAVAGTVNNGDTVAVQQTSSASYSTLTTSTLTIGGVAGAFDVTTLAQDTTPTAFTFTAQTGVALSSVATSNTITVAGINSAASISIAGGGYSINGGAYTAVAGTVNNGDEVTVRQTSSGSYSTLTTATLTIGGVSGAFQVTALNLAVSSIVVDPVAPSILYAGLDGAGVYKSTDGGANWSAASTQPSNTRIKELVIKPGDSAALFAATYGGGVFKSADSGVNWSACATQPANLNLLSLTMDAAGKLYAGSEAGVFVSSDGCASWAAINTGLPF